MNISAINNYNAGYNTNFKGLEKMQPKKLLTQF